MSFDTCRARVVSQARSACLDVRQLVCNRTDSRTGEAQIVTARRDAHFTIRVRSWNSIGRLQITSKLVGKFDEFVGQLHELARAQALSVVLVYACFHGVSFLTMTIGLRQMRLPRVIVVALMSGALQFGHPALRSRGRVSQL